MNRALREYRIRGVTTNLAFLENVLTHPDFVANRYTTKFIDETPGLLTLAKRRDRATRPEHRPWVAAGLRHQISSGLLWEPGHHP